MEFEGALSRKMDANPVAVVEALIHINNQLHQHEVCFASYIGLLSLSLIQYPSSTAIVFTSAGCCWNIDLCPANP